jgi:hypothetical protein
VEEGIVTKLAKVFADILSTCEGFDLHTRSVSCMFGTIHHLFLIKPLLWLSAFSQKMLRQGLS